MHCVCGRGWRGQTSPGGNEQTCQKAKQIRRLQAGSVSRSQEGWLESENRGCERAAVFGAARPRGPASGRAARAAMLHHACDAACNCGGSVCADGGTRVRPRGCPRAWGACFRSVGVVPQPAPTPGRGSILRRSGVKRARASAVLVNSVAQKWGPCVSPHARTRSCLCLVSCGRLGGRVLGIHRAHL